MAYTMQYGRRAYGGNGTPHRELDGISVPGYDSAYFYNLLTTTGQTAYGGSAYGGRRSVVYPAAGMFAAADPDHGFVTLPTWWAFASYVNVSRVGSDGTRTPVRGSSPVILTGLSRRNAATNPKARDDLTGYTAGANTTLSRLTNQTTPSQYVTTSIRAKATATGSVNVNLSLDAMSPSGQVLGFWVRTSALVAGLSVSVTWYDASSTSLGTQVYAAPATVRTEAVNAWSWVEIPVAPAPTLAAVASGVASIVATGVAANATVDVTGRIIEQGLALQGDYFDGDYPGSTWIGTPGLSFSDSAPINTLVDGECPLDTEVYYELTNPLAAGITVTSNPVTLSSRGNRAWLTHPSRPTIPVRVNVLGPFGPITRKIVQGTYYPLDSTDGLPIVKTQSRRRGREGSIKILSLSHEERDELLDLFADGAPVMIRSPKTYGHGTMWLSLGDLTEDQAAYWSESPFRTLSADYTEVAAPLTANEAV